MNYKFWVYVNGSPVRLTLKPGQTVQHSTGGQILRDGAASPSSGSMRVRVFTSNPSRKEGTVTVIRRGGVTDSVLAKD